MEDNRILRFVIAIILTVNVILYPVGKILTSPERINGALNSIQFEKEFLNIFEKFTASQLALRFSTSTESMEEIISKSLISEEQLQKQREIAVNEFYESISAKEIPTLKFELEDPVNKFQNNVMTISKGFISDITDNINICSKNPTNIICKGINDLISKISPQEEVATSTSPSDIESEGSKLLSFQTSLGINQDNIENIYQVYRTFKYGPDILLLLTIVLCVIGYLLTIPNTKFSLNLFILGVKESIFAITIWYALPILINLTNPIKIQSTANIETGVNNLLAEGLYVISRLSLVLPLSFTVITGILTGLIFLVTKYIKLNKTQETNKIQNLNNIPSTKEESATDVPINPPN